MTAAEVLRRAKAEIQRRGLWQGGWFSDPEAPSDDECRLCSLAAINVAAGLRIDSCSWNAAPVVLEATDLLASAAGGGLVSKWSDEAESVDVVLDGFDRAIALAEGEVAP